MKLLLLTLASLAIVASVLAEEEERSPYESMTDEDRAALRERQSKLSPEAQAAAATIRTAVEANKGNRTAIRAAIDDIKKGLTEEVKKELASVAPKRKEHHHGEHKHGEKDSHEHEGHHHGEGEECGETTTKA